MIERYIRFQKKNETQPRWGMIEGVDIQEISHAPWKDSVQRSGELLKLSDVMLLAPVEPTKILAFGYNYRDLFKDKAAKARENEPHFSDVGFEPVVFLKSPNCIAAPEAAIQFPNFVSEVWVEVEVAVVIGKKAKDIQTEKEAKDVLFGLTIGNDITALNISGRDWHLARSKALDGFCPIGPELVRGFDDSNCKMTTLVNERLSQSSESGQRILNSLQSIIFASKLMTLEPGDVILTGTPLGGRQSIVKPGDQSVLKIDGLGQLRNTFVN